MNKGINCGCKGIRKCLLCGSNECVSGNTDSVIVEEFTYCAKCGKAFSSSEEGIEDCNSAHGSDAAVEFPGIDILQDFVTEEEEMFLCSQINDVEWKLSQSGRLKQDYGPKVNFKKQKVNAKQFIGLPSYSRFLVERFTLHECIQSFTPVELCNLEYRPERGSAIDPHFDDWWLWGERLLTLNLLSDVVMTFSRDCQPELVVRVRIPRRAMIVVSGPARNVWKHSIRRQDVVSCRIAMTFRELSIDFCPGGVNENVGSDLVTIASSFAG